ncbi:hypothetical protein L6R53_25770 [Myxococcota bacterium]|nr:hypothetical protein [Myxococcota bacterium]
MLDTRNGLWRLRGGVRTGPPKADRPPVPEDLSSRITLSPRPDDTPTTHPDLLAEVFVGEGKGVSGTSVDLRWDDGLVVLGAPSRKDEEGERVIEHARAGTIWVHYGGARLPIAVLPRHLIQDSEHPGEAMLRLQALVSDLWRNESRPHLHAEKSREDHQPGVAVRTGSSQRHWPQRLKRLHDMLFQSDGVNVQAAWQALMAEPVVRLESEYPVVPMHRARRAVLAGPRGPWSLAGGWSPHSPAGDVRERVVRRSGDTPPHRLAVGLANLVLSELWIIRRDAGPDLDRSGLSLWVAHIQQTAESVLSCPAFSDVPLQAEVALDSPALQGNARCRPLLVAWDRLHRGIALDRAVPLDDVMLEPLAKVHTLYERWCYVALCQAAEQVLRTPRRRWGDSEDHLVIGAEVIGEHRGHPVTVRILHAADGAPDPGDDLSQGEWDTRAKTREATWGGIIESWSVVSKPDGIIVVEVDGHKAVHAWDAKYRKFKKNDPRALSGYLYQAHAFRDALTFCEDGSDIGWSAVVHPGLAKETVRSKCWVKGKGTPDLKGKETKTLVEDHQAQLSNGGVCIMAAAPAATDEAGPRHFNLEDLIRLLIESSIVPQHRRSP